MARYGTQESVPFNEGMTPCPQDPYGVAKYSAELVIRDLCHLHGMEYVIAVPHNIIGPRQKYDNPYRNVVSIMINLMLQGRQPVIYGDGQQKRCFSFVQDVVGSLEKMGSMSSLQGEVINIGPDEEFITVNELATRISGLLDFDLHSVHLPDRPGEVKYATCSAAKARQLLGYRTTYSLARGLQEMIDDIRQRGTKTFHYHIPLEIVNAKTPLSWKDRLF